MISPRQQLTPVILIVLVGLILGLPCLLYGFPYYGDDSVSQVIRYAGFVEHLGQGDLYPRWLMSLNEGLGGTDLFFQSALPFYLTTIFRPFVRAEQFGWRELGVGACVALIASGITFYLWLKTHVEVWPATLAAITYLALPYHVNIDLYGRGAYSELWTFVWVPLVLNAIDQIAKRNRLGLPCLAVSYALSIATSLPATLIFSPVAAGYAWFHIPKVERKRGLIQVATGLFLGVGLTAFYVLPALALKRFTFLDEGSSGHYVYANWFLFGRLNWSSVRAEIFWFTLEVIALALLAFIASRDSQIESHTKERRFWVVTALLSFWLMTPLSKPVWAVLPMLQDVQFPWRFNLVLTLSTATLLGIALTTRARASTAAVVLRIALIALLGVWFYDLGRRSWVAYPVHYVDQVEVNERNKALQQRRSENVYRTRWVVSLQEGELASLVQRINKHAGGGGVANLADDGTASIERWDPKGIVVVVDARKPTVVTLSQFYFPGWAATLDDNRPLEVTPSIPDGLTSVVVPKGMHRVIVRRVPTAPERIGAAISGTAVLLLVLLLFASPRLLGVHVVKKNAIGS